LLTVTPTNNVPLSFLIMIMKRSTLLPVALASSLLFATLGNAQTVATDPVGFTTHEITPAVNATTPRTTTVSVPFKAIAAFASSVASVDSANQLTISGAAFTAGQYAGATAPHLLKLKTGPNTGRFFLITANTATQLTVNAAGYTLTSAAPANNNQVQVEVGNLIEIIPANTLSSLFPNPVPFQTGGSAAAADNVYLYNAGWEVYFHNGTTWRKTGSFANQDNTVVYPDDGLFIVRRGIAPLTLTFLGAVPTTAERTDFPGPGSYFATNRFPVGTTLGGASGLNLQALPNWQTGASAAVADNVYIWDGTGWGVFFHNNTSWRKTGSFANQDSQSIPIGGALFVVRKSTAPGTTGTYVQPLPYTP